MKTVCSFVAKFASVISWVLSCFDRVIFKGHLPISRAYEFENFVDYRLNMRRADFVKTLGPAWSNRLVEHAKLLAQKYGRVWEYGIGDIDKDAWAKKHLQAHPITEGLVGILCVMEACRTFKLKPGKDRPCFVSRKVPQRVLYYYFIDRELGLMHVRLQTWAPFTCQVYANGHDFVARQLKKKGIAFEQVDNAFVELADPVAAQRIADRFAKLPWPKILERYARQVNPLLHAELKGLSHYWVIDQAEYATDLRFAGKQALAGLFVRLLEFALLTFSPKKIFCYLGRKWHERFDGEIQTHYKSVREPGVCLKHFMKRNWLKMYDKLGLLLRVETVINQPGEFKVLRECRHRDGTTTTGWFAMCKGVGNMHHYQPMNSGSKPNSMKSRVWLWPSRSSGSFERAVLGAKADRGFAHALLDDLLQAAEGAADDEQDVLGVDGAGRFAAALGEIHHRLDLAGDVAGRAGRHLGFLHELEQVGLHAAPADVAARHTSGGGDLVNLVNVDDAVLGAGDVAIGQAQQVAHHVFDVAAHVAGFGELGGIGFDEGHADQVGGAADEEGLADAGGADEDDVLLGVIGRFLAVEREADMVIMVAEGDAQDFLGLVLLDDEPVEVVLNVARLVFELEVLGPGLRRGALRHGGIRGLGGRLRPGALKMLAHEVGELPLKFFGRRRSIRY